MKFIGRGTGIVIATGAETEFGVIFSMMQDVRPLLCALCTQRLIILGRGTPNAATTKHGRTRQETLIHIIWRDWRYLSHWRPPTTLLAGHVYYRW